MSRMCLKFSPLGRCIMMCVMICDVLESGGHLVPMVVKKGYLALLDGCLKYLCCAIRKYSNYSGSGATF